MIRYSHTLFRQIIQRLVITISILVTPLSTNAQSQAFTNYDLPDTINKTSAEQQLNKVLFSHKAPSFGSQSNTNNAREQLRKAVHEADARMAKRARLGFPLINPIRIPTYQLGLRAACLEDCDDRVEIIKDINRSVNRDTGSGIVVLPAGDNLRSFNLFEEFIRQYCSDLPSEKCAQATLTAIDLWQLAGIYRAFANVLNAQDKAFSKQTLSLLDQQWRSYKDDTIKLWPHEAVLSSVLFRQNQEGFTAPPNYKLLTFRPTLGLSYLSEGSPDFRPTVNLDLLGIYWWKYNGTKATKGRGIAASLIWSGDDTAYGVTYHHNPKWSTTLAHSSDNDMVLSVSFQLAYALFN